MERRSPNMRLISKLTPRAPNEIPLIEPWCCPALNVAIDSVAVGNPHSCVRLDIHSTFALFSGKNDLSSYTKIDSEVGAWGNDRLDLGYWIAKSSHLQVDLRA